MVDAAATIALETLRDLFIEEVRFLSCVEGQVEDVARDLQAMRGFLKDADKRQDRYESDSVGKWVLELMDLATRAEDVLVATIYECPELMMIPEGMIFMASITNLTILEMPRNFIERLRREDYHKISHIPVIDLGEPPSSPL